MLYISEKGGYMKRTLCLFMAILLLFPVVLSGCQSANSSDEQEQILVYLPGSSYLGEVIRKYNRYLVDNNYENRYKINVKLFDDKKENTSITKMVTEIMAGAGPDIIALETDIPFEKLMQQSIFADINEMIENDTSEEKLDLSVYNSAIMDSCVVDGKRLMIPLAFSLNVMSAPSDLCSEYNIPVDKGLSYSNSPEALKDYLEKTKESKELTVFGDFKAQLLNLIDDYVDFGESKVYFDTPQFQNDFKELCKLNIDNNSDNSNKDNKRGIYRDPYSFFENFYGSSSSLFQPVFDSFFGFDVFSGSDSHELINGINKSESDIKATVKYAMAVNANSNKKQEVLEFIKYALSQHIQTDWMNGYMPVNNQSFGMKLYYSTLEQNRYLGNDSDGSNSAEFVEKFLTLVDGVNVCNIPNSYYHNNIIGDIVDDFISGKISEQKFLNQLKSKTNIFVNE